LIALRKEHELEKIVRKKMELEKLLEEKKALTSNYRQVYKILGGTFVKMILKGIHNSMLSEKKKKREI